MCIERIKERLVYDNDYLSLFDDDVKFPNGRTGRYVRAAWKCTYCIGVVALTNQMEVILVRQYCYASARSILQIPKGMGIPGRDPKELAREELVQETGAVAKSLDHLITFHLDPSFVETPYHIYLARNALIKYSRSTEPSEVIHATELIPLSYFSRASITKKVTDPVTLGAVKLVSDRMAS
jgi:hypothetical protein